MSFLSLSFALFLTVAVCGFHLLPGHARPAYLLLASYAFYLAVGWRHALLLLVVTAISWLAGLRVGETAADEPAQRRQERLTLAAVAVLLAVLAAFKYGPAFPAGPGSPAAVASALIPLGISYYVFRLISYVLDVAWGRTPRETSFLRFASYPVFFPQVVSGPIQRSGDYLEQLAGATTVPPAVVRRGLRLILFGVFEKAVVANGLGHLVDSVFAAPERAHGLSFLVATYAFAFQLYADFSGVSDIAIGASALLGITAPPNFDSPYTAPNIQQFWRRWHMSLTSWLTDYLFTPLRMRLRHWGEAGLLIALGVNMLAIGVWHGARWTFVAFGLLNFVYVAVSTFTLRPRNRFFKARPRLQPLRCVLGPLIVFHLMAIAFVFFRAESLGQAWYVLQHLVPDALPPGQRFRGLGINSSFDLVGLVAVPAMLAVQAAARSEAATGWFEGRPRWLRWSVYYAAVAAIVLAGDTERQAFIYERF